jgi:hypothetical protein
VCATAALATGLPACTTGPDTPPSSASPTAAVTPSPAGDPRVEGWLGDLDGLLPAIGAIHPDPYHSTPEPRMEAEVRDLERAVPNATDDELMVGVMRLVAMVSADGRDGHTGVFVWGTGEFPVHSLPLRLWTFADGPFVVDALGRYRGLVGDRVVSIGGRPVTRVLDAVHPLVPRDNASTVELVTPRLVLIPEVLHGLGLAGSAGAVALGVETPSGATRTVLVRPVPMSRYNDWATAYGLDLPERPGAPYFSDHETPLRSERAGDTLVIQYNRVETLPAETLDELERALARPDLRRVVVDIRWNYGGETFGYDDLLDLLVHADRAGAALFVITGRNTFSAASLFAAELEERTDATFVGEAMGGSPNLYGNPDDVELPFSGLDVTVASEYFVRSTPDDPRLTIRPDLWIEPTSADWFAGRDPAMEAIADA